MTAKKSAAKLHQADKKPMTMTQLAKVKSKTKSHSHAKLSAKSGDAEPTLSQQWDTYFTKMAEYQKAHAD